MVKRKAAAQNPEKVDPVRQQEESEKIQILSKSSNEQQPIEDELDNSAGCACHSSASSGAAKSQDDFYTKEKAATASKSKNSKKPKISKSEKDSSDKETMKVSTIVGLHHPLKWVGAHISAAGGLSHAVDNAMKIQGMAFALFLKSQRRWDNPPLAPNVASAFIDAARSAGYLAPTSPNSLKTDLNEDSKSLRNCILPHGSYLINLANADAQKRQRSYENFLDDLKRCEACHIGLYNFHPGSTVGSCTVEEGIQHIAEAINQAHAETSFVTVVLENMVVYN